MTDPDANPITPGWIPQFQFITFYALQDCDAPFSLYIEFAQPIARQITLQYLQFDEFAFIKRIFRPKWIRTARHGRKGRRGGPRGGGIPEFNDMVADVLDPNRDFQPDRVHWTYRLLFEWDDIVERIGHKYFVIDSIFQLTYGTILGVIESSPALCPSIGRFSRRHPPRGPVTPLFTWYAIPMGDLDYYVKWDDGTAFGSTAFEGSYVCVLSGRVQNTSLTEGTAELAIWTGGGGTLLATTGPLSVPGLGYQDMIIEWRGTAPFSVSWHIKVVSANFEYFDMRFQAFQVG